MLADPERAMCYTCGVIVSLRIASQDFTDGSRHLRGSCPTCNRWIKWVAYEEPKLYVGKYANLPLATIYQCDPEYLKWALENLRLSTRVRTAIEELV